VIRHWGEAYAQGDAGLNIAGSDQIDGTYSLPPYTISPHFDDYMDEPQSGNEIAVLLACDFSDEFVRVDGWPHGFANACYKEFFFPFAESELFGATFVLDEILIAEAGTWTVTLPP